MEYPIYIDGAERGRLSVTQEGLRTRLTAKCEKQQGIIRLSVYGGGEKAYLGVLSPQGDVLFFTKSCSKNEMRCFPKKIEYAANGELKREEATPEEETKWIMSTRGCLVCTQGEQKLVAIPADPDCLSQTGLVREIDGGYYLIFRK